ncbi:hypothetical protein J2Z42_002210 [Clostridium algifaecis]|uniref:Bacterial Ig-like domain-containing protein n=1 Tax=Clostridium algifaecis TaxID=1472040 RepID=A0ABS4KU00_9CLOT|nr:Ig-like domain-containing protein [Clostridium algifaecis]MBP2033507.1 hypothetical protein [Clostridium algifaecis]
MKNFTKNLILFCGICAITQLSSHSIVFATSNTDKPSIESSKIVQSNLSKNNNEKTLSSTSQITNNNDSSAEASVSASNVKNTSADNSSKSTTTDTPQRVNSSSIINNGDYNNIVGKDNVPVDKVWQIRFSEPVDIQSLDGKIKLIDESTNKEVPIRMTGSNFDQVVSIVPLITLDPQNQYNLTFSDTITSKFGKKLSNPTLLNFTTSPVIKSIDNLTASINQWQDYSLPTTVNANMSDGTTTSVAVSWDKSVDTSQAPGNYTYTGTITGYGTVTLTLTINSFQPVSSISNSKRTQSSTGVNLYNYLMNYNNRQDVLQRAIQLHGGDTSNNCAYYASEALRRVNVNVPTYTANTNQLTSTLQNLGWKISTDLSYLLPGDICFTVSYGSGPTHTYTFMKWLDPKNYNYAYVCDNQGNEYNNDALHTRPIEYGSETKDPISYFMYLA